LANGKAGEGRFVFGVLDSSGSETSFTVILEYNLPAKTEADVKNWGLAFQRLSRLKFGPVFNAKLEKLTQRFAAKNRQAMFRVSLNTCNGCHGGETNTSFLHIRPRQVGEKAFLSRYLTGISVTDPRDGASMRQFNELAFRKADLQAMLCTPRVWPAALAEARDGRVQATD
jgi:hypothetical protein